MADFEVIPRVERRRKWSEQEKAALLAEVEADGSVAIVAKRHAAKTRVTERPKE